MAVFTVDRLNVGGNLVPETIPFRIGCFRTRCSCCSPLFRQSEIATLRLVAAMLGLGPILCLEAALPQSHTQKHTTLIVNIFDTVVNYRHARNRPIRPDTLTACPYQVRKDQ